MKILHINSYYNSGMFYKNLYDKQIKNGLEIDVYVPVSNSVASSNIEMGDYTKISVNHGKYDRFLFHLKHSKICKDIINKYDISSYTLTHAHSLFSNGYIALKLKLNYGIPYVVAIRNTDVNLFFRYMIHLRKLGVQIITEAKKVIFLSKPYQKMVLTTYVPPKHRDVVFSKSVVVPNGIDDFWLTNKPDKLTNVKKNKINICFAGKITKNKNVLTTIKACQVLIDKGYDVEFSVYGQIMDWREYKMVRSYDFVTYIEHQPKEKLVELFRKNDIFVMPSKTETFGLVYAEAMSQGLPVIYSRGQGFDGQFEEGEVGYSVRYNSAEEIAERMLDIIANYEKISWNCKSKVDKFNWDVIAKLYTWIYSK